MNTGYWSSGFFGTQETLLQTMKTKYIGRFKLLKIKNENLNKSKNNMGFTELAMTYSSQKSMQNNLGLGKTC